MIIKVDTEGLRVINQLVDIALKAGGLSNLEGVSKILSSIQQLDGKGDAQVAVSSNKKVDVKSERKE